MDEKMLVPVGKGYSRFKAEALEQALKKVVFDNTKNENTPLADKGTEICAMFVLSTRARDAGHPRLFRSYGFDRDECPIWQAARATTAAPTYFPPAWVTVPFPGEWYVDGGVTQNNPSPYALKEGKSLWNAKRCLLVSVGTGIQKRADLAGNKKPLDHDGEPTDDPLVLAVPVASSHGPEETSDAQSAQPRMDLGLRKAAVMFGKAASPIRSVVEKATQLGRFPGGFATATRFLQELAKLSTESEKTHGVMYAESDSNDSSAQFRYYRFNVQNDMGDIGLEEWQQWDLIVTLTRNYLDSVDVPARLTQCARDLLHPPRFEST